MVHVLYGEENANLLVRITNFSKEAEMVEDSGLVVVPQGAPVQTGKKRVLVAELGHDAVFVEFDRDKRVTVKDLIDGHIITTQNPLVYVNHVPADLNTELEDGFTVAAVKNIIAGRWVEIFQELFERKNREERK